jgi:hypothetical protein
METVDVLVVNWYRDTSTAEGVMLVVGHYAGAGVGVGTSAKICREHAVAYHPDSQTPIWEQGSSKGQLPRVDQWMRVVVCYS